MTMIYCPPLTVSFIFSFNIFLVLINVNWILLAVLLKKSRSNANVKYVCPSIFGPADKNEN